MIPTKLQMIEVFKDTLKFFDEDSTLSGAISLTNSQTKVYPADFAEETDARKAGKIEVIPGRTLQTALRLHEKFPEKKIAVLNFAASQTPGGGVKSGSRAQEESICRSSTLYPSLMTEKAREGFYSFHHKGGWRASDTCIYSPGVVICKIDDDYIPARLKPEEFVKIDVVTCAAPHIFWDVEISAKRQYEMQISRARNILRVCAHNDADIFIGGAFGCGAFHNDPKIVADAWLDVLKTYRWKFDLVAFTVKCYDPPKNNFDVFREILSDA